MTLYTAPSLTIGRGTNATPELNLSQTVDLEHVQFRIGNMRGSLNFADLNSATGSTVYLHENDTRMLGFPRREFRKMAGGLVAQRQIEGHWLR